MKKVLCLDYYFPPLRGGWVGGFKFIRLLPEFGWQPTVISAAETVSYPKDYSLLAHLPENIEVHRVGHREPSKIWGYLRNQLKVNFDFPDVRKNWYFPALNEAREILRRESADLILSISPSYTAAFVAMQLHHEFNIPWVLELEDAWSNNDYLHQYYKQVWRQSLRQWQQQRIRSGERDILQAANKIIVIHPTLQRELQRLHSIGQEKIELITDGYYESDYSQLKPHVFYPDKLKIAFLGGAYLGYSEIISTFLKAIQALDVEIEMIFIGRGASEVQVVGETNVTLLHHLPKEKALPFAAGADFLLLVVIPPAKWHIPSKLYDYLRLGKPILALVPEDGDAAEIIRKAKAGFILSFNETEMKQQLHVIFDEWQRDELKDFRPDSHYIAQFERRKLTERIVQVFNKTIC